MKEGVGGGVGGSKGGVPNVNFVIVPLRIERGRQVAVVGPCNSAAVNGANGGIVGQAKAHLYAGKNVQVRVTFLYRSHCIRDPLAEWIGRVRPWTEESVGIEEHLISNQAFVRTFEAQACLYSEAPDVDGIHQIPGRNALNQIVVVGVRILGG